MQIIKFNLFGIPKAKQSTKFHTFKVGDRTVASAFQPQDIVDGKINLRAQIIEQLPDGFIPFSNKVAIMELRFKFPYLKTFSKKKIKEMESGLSYRYKTTKPDLDNLEKMLWDAMNGIVFTDDSLICAKHLITKEYSNIPGIKIRISGK